MSAIKSVLCRIFAPQKRVTEGKRTLLFATGIYFLLLIWAIVFKFSAISKINMNSAMSLGDRFLRGLRFFDFFLESNPWRLVRGLLIAILTFFCLCRGAFTHLFSMTKREPLALPALFHARSSAFNSLPDLACSPSRICC